MSCESWEIDRIVPIYWGRKIFLDQKDTQIENGVFYSLAANYFSRAKFFCHVANVMFTGFEASPNITPRYTTI